MANVIKIKGGEGPPGQSTLQERELGIDMTNNVLYYGTINGPQSLGVPQSVLDSFVKKSELSTTTVGLAVALTTSAGNSTTPVYFSNGKPVACTAYSSASVASAAALTTNAGNSTTPVYFSGGKPVACTAYSNASVASAASAAALTTSSAGNSTTPVYFSNGKPVACNTNGLIGYYTCSTAAGTAAKVGTYSYGMKYTSSNLVTGAIALVKFTNANSASSPTLNLNSSGAKSIMQYGTTAISTSASTSGWQAGAVCIFVYDGTNWVRNQGYNTNTTYSAATTSANGLMSSADKTKLDKIGYATLSVSFSGGHAYDVAVSGIKQNATITAIRLDTHTHTTGTWEMTGIGAIKATADGKVDIHQIAATNGTWPIAIIYVNP